MHPLVSDTLRVLDRIITVVFRVVLLATPITLAVMPVLRTDVELPKEA